MFGPALGAVGEIGAIGLTAGIAGVVANELGNTEKAAEDRLRG
jgi:hypothetical protein